MKEIDTDKELQEIHRNRNGFVFNDYSGKRSSGKDFNVLHKSSCRCISRCNINYHKIFFEHENEAIEWLSADRGTNWKHCDICNPRTSNAMPLNPSIKRPLLVFKPLKTVGYSEPVTFYVDGEPSSFSTAREKPWKINLEQQIPDKDRNGIEKGIVLDFHLKSMKINGHYFDVDNLCEPVFSILINKIGWFKGKRPNIQWFRASKINDIQSGCGFTIYNSLEPDSHVKYKTLIYNKTYTGNLPKSATDNEFISWVEENYTRVKNCTSFYLNIEFGNPRINLGDIATGKVKSIVDCLYPIIGGNLGNPEDWRIDILEVRKGVKTISEEAIRVLVAEL